jgi:CTP synthase
MPYYIFVGGGVMSSVGQGCFHCFDWKILQNKGFNVTALKIDPFINIDAGTMNPSPEHGEVL